MRSAGNLITGFVMRFLYMQRPEPLKHTVIIRYIP